MPETLLDHVSPVHGDRVESLPLREARKAFDRAYLLGLLMLRRGNVSAVLVDAGMGDRSALYRKMRHVGISIDQVRKVRERTRWRPNNA